MTIATKMEERIVDRINQDDVGKKRFIKIAAWIFNRQADRQEAKRLLVSINEYKKLKKKWSKQ